ncbi:MAG: MFS transporter [Polyangiales bacterium]
MTDQTTPRRAVAATVLVGALGYFVDIYDLLLFSIVRVASLRDLGVRGDALLDEGLSLLSIQMWGLLVGGVLWGVLGDKRGRLSVLFGSILIYSVANIANAYVDTVRAYSIWRFIAGVGLAGELGAAITLVSETMPARSRGYGTALVAGIGLLGAVVAALVGKHFSWRVAYQVGGGLGIALLIARLSTFESGMFAKVKAQEGVSRGDLTMLLRSWPRFKRYARCVLIGLPIWYVVGILVTASPEFARAFGATGPVSAGDAVLWTYAGLVVGDLSSGVLSQWLGSRKRVVGIYLLLTAVFTAGYLLLRAPSPALMYGLCALLGVAIGYWAVFVTIAAEQFGTNLRATVTTTVPNLVRGSVPIITLAFVTLRTRLSLGMVWSAAIVGGACYLIAGLSLVKLEEAYGKDLDYVE